MASTSPTKPETVDGLLKALLVLARTADRVLCARAVESAVDAPLSPSTVRVLRLLGHRGPKNFSQIARFLGVSKAAVTQIIDAMEGGKLVLRQPAQRDRRETKVQLTGQEKTLFRAIHRRQQLLVRIAVQDLEPGDVDRWIETLQSAAVAMATADRVFEHFCLQCAAHTDGTCVLEGGHADCTYLAQIGAT